MRTRLIGAIDLTTNIVTRACKRPDQLIGTASGLRRDQGEIAYQHATAESSDVVLCGSAQRFSQRGDASEQDLNLFEGDVRRVFLAGRRQTQALKQ